MSQRIGRYEVLEELGKGGMGIVYRARDPELHRSVAIKVVLAWAQYDPEAMKRFNREARVVAQLQHPHIVTVFDAGRTEEGLPYFVMELLEGTDLSDVLGASGSLAPSRAVRYVLQVCEGLVYAHARDIVHRDIKPANLLITPEDTIKIVDFGIAKLVGSQITGTGVSLGTPLYMAPEQVAGKTVDHRADIFAVGGVLYTLISGHPPFEAPTLGGICHKIESEAPQPFARLGIDVHPRLEAIILEALEKDPEERYQSAAELAADLREIEADVQALATAPTVISAGSAPASPVTRTEPIQLPRRRPGRTLALAAVALIAAAAALWSFPELRPWPEGRESAETAQASDEGSAAAGSASAAAESETTSTAVPETAVSGADASASGIGTSTETESGAAAATDAGPTTAEAAGAAGAAADAPSTDRPTGDEAAAVDPGPDEAASLYPASIVERAAVNRIVSALVRAVEAKDSAAIARVFGGRVPEREWRMLNRMLQGPRMRIRYQMGSVGSTGEGVVLAEVHNDILFLGQPGRVPPPRRSTWVMRFGSDKTGLYLQRIRPR
ncbi:MAG: serine/threonine protein kinase [Gemmatimonadota bacterium]|nr:MAG: serine/threonine protein kinase [Gemmatimonadota bacterium]